MHIIWWTSSNVKERSLAANSLFKSMQVIPKFRNKWQMQADITPGTINFFDFNHHFRIHIYLPGWCLNASLKNLQDDERTTLWARRRWCPTTNTMSVNKAWWRYSLKAENTTVCKNDNWETYKYWKIHIKMIEYNWKYNT